VSLVASDASNTHHQIREVTVSAMDGTNDTSRPIGRWMDLSDMSIFANMAVWLGEAA
jgi:hypothetical protein